jgi:hypothetical protein
MAGYQPNNKSKQGLFQEIDNALSSVDFGSVDIIVQDGEVTQISVRSIRKTSHSIKDKEDKQYFTVDAPIKKSKAV